MKDVFVTINGNTQLADVFQDGRFLSEIALTKGINEINILAFGAKGGSSRKKLKLLYSPPRGVPIVVLRTPENGRQGVKSGDSIIVSGTVDDTSIKRALLIFNGVRINIRVINGRFRKKINLNKSRVNTFRIAATSRNGRTGYSARHTVLIGYDIDIINPRPY